MRRLGAILCLIAVAGSQDTPPETRPQPQPDARYEVKLKSGSILIGHIQPEEWTVTTAFGVLRVPIADIKFVMFGRRADAERVARVRSAIHDLASGNADRRNRARALLKKNGLFAARDLQRAVKAHEDPEVKRICAEILDELDLDEEEAVPDDDRVETSLFTLAGTIEPSSFKVTVPELGALNVRRKDIVTLRRIDVQQHVVVKVTGQHTWPNGWVDAGISFKKGARMRIKATGVIEFPKWGNQTFGPDGRSNMGQISGVTMCALAGRVGPSGPPFMIGSSYEGRAPVKGKLYLLMMVNLRGQPPNGEFTVTIQR